MALCGRRKAKRPEMKPAAWGKLTAEAAAHCARARGEKPKTGYKPPFWETASLFLVAYGFQKTVLKYLNEGFVALGRPPLTRTKFEGLFKFFIPVMLIPYALSWLWSRVLTRTGTISIWMFKSSANFDRFALSFRKMDRDKSFRELTAIAVRQQSSSPLSSVDEYVSAFQKWYLPELADVWKEILDSYDIVHTYGYDGFVPLLYADRDYVSFEHGTIRHAPFQATDEGRMTEVVYKQAKHVFISNCDNILSAQKLGLQRFSFLPHPMNEEIVQSLLARKSAFQHPRIQESDFVIFHPPRHHWDEVIVGDPSWQKGNHIFIKSFARFVRSENPNAKAVCVEFGQMVEKSKALIRQLGIEMNVIWVAPLTGVEMMEMIARANVTVDQFILPTLGSIPARVMSMMRPVITVFDPKLHEWCFPEMPPILSCPTEEETYQALVRLHRSEDERKEIGIQGERWYQKYHSWRKISEEVEVVYREFLGLNR